MYPEGLVTPFLMVAMVTIAGLCVESSDWARIVTPVAVIALLAALFGSVIAKLRVLDSLAHMLSIVLGVGISFAIVATRADGVEGGFRDRVREIGDVGLQWYLGQRVDREMEALLVSLLLGIVVWLVGYLAAWLLFRRGWILAAVLLPGFLILVNLGYSDDPQTGYLAAFVFVALILAARHSLYMRQREWSRLRIGGPTGMASRFLVTGVIVALIATSVGWRSPSSFSQEAFQPLVGEVSSKALSAQEKASEWLRDVGANSPTEIQTSGSYTSFGESFSIGGPLELTDQPQVLVFADEAPYLIAQHYDSYSGRGWYSTTEETFDPNGVDGRRYSPEMTFVANQEVPLSDNVNTSRSAVAVEITPLNPMGDGLLTVDTYLSSSVQASVRMSWIQLDDDEFPIQGLDVGTLPRDLQRIASMLQVTVLSGDDSGFGPVPEDANEGNEITTERDQLMGRFLDVRWTADEDGKVQSLVVSGQLPVYDDVESVSSNDPAVTDGTYRVVASASRATSDDLQQAGTEYPDWVSQRYLSLPDTITPRTVELTQTITAASDNPYDQARAIEQYLRMTIVYDESVEAPPEGNDIVDYLLFERQRGYCEYSASAMTVMLRSIGIPARVAVGFYPGDYDQSQAGYLYLQKNAHAWTEVYFPEYGWIPFEPTSSQPLIEEGNGIGQDESEPEPTSIAIEETPIGATPTSEASPVSGQGEADTAQPQVTPNPEGSGIDWLLVAGLGTLLAVALSIVGWFFWSYPLRGMTASSSLFTRLRRIGSWIGVRPSATSTPQEYGRAFTDRVPQVQDHVNRIVEIYEIDQFGPERASSGWLSSAEDAWKSIKRQAPHWFLRWRR